MMPGNDCSVQTMLGGILFYWTLYTHKISICGTDAEEGNGFKTETEPYKRIERVRGVKEE